MSHSLRLTRVAIALLWTLAGPPVATGPALAAEQPKVVITFDFVSKFDQGRYGQMAADGLFKKLGKERSLVVPESMEDVRDTLKANNLAVTPDTPLEAVKAIVRGTFDAQIGVWGSVERVAGFDADVYDLVMKCVDFSADPPNVIYECKARTNSVSEIPHLYMKQLVDAVCRRKPGEKPGADPVAEENWAKNPNLVKGGDFERGTKGIPAFWESTAGQAREPLGNLAKWTAEKGNDTNKVLRFDIPKAVAESTGVMYYSKPFPVQEGATYRFQCRYRTDGPSPKVFIKCYDELPTEYRRTGPYVDKSKSTAGPAARGGSPADSLPDPEVSAGAREVYRNQENLKGPPNQWNVQTEDFTPRHTKYTPRSGRVMLYGYLKQGSIEWDDVVIKQILPPKGDEQDKEKRHSLDTKVTIKEMEENVRRSNEARERARRERAAKSDSGP